MTDNFASLFEESIKKLNFQEGAIIRGLVLRIENGYVLIDAGLKSEALVPVEQFKNLKGELNLKVGDTVEVALDAVEDNTGETKLSRERAKRTEVWRRLEEACKNHETVEGIITSRVKGGFTVELEGVKAFLPGSLLDTRPLKETSHLENKPIALKVVKIDDKRSNIVVSRRAVLEEEGSAERQSLLENMREGQQLKGVVKNLTDYGAFIDLGGVDGLLHITDMSWKRIKHPSEMIQVGDEIDVVVLKFEREKGRVSLGIKQLGNDPWKNLMEKFEEGKKMRGKVTNIADYGCFVEIAEGVEGLVHVSEMDWTNKNANPSKLVQIGQEVDVMILDIDSERRRISLGMKQCQSNPWHAFADQYKKGDKISGSIKSITDFGVFIGLPGGIDGLIHLSDLSWSQSGDEAVKNFKKGDVLDAVVLGIDVERERVSLGVKQLADDPFSAFMAQHEKGSTIKVKVTEVEEKGAFVDVDNMKGYIRVQDLSAERVSDARKVVKAGEEIEAVVTGLDRKNQLVNLSVRALEEVSEETKARYLNNNSQPNATLGDLLKEKLNSKE